MNVTVKQALGGSFVEFEMAGNNSPIPEVALEHMMGAVKQILQKSLAVVNCLKFYVVCEATYQKSVESAENRFGFASKMRVVYQSTNIEDLVKESLEKIMGSMESFEARGSGWIFLKFTKIRVHVVKLHPTSAASYIPLPDLLRGKRSLLNIRNDDDLCFVYCILAALYPPKNNQNLASSYKKYLHYLNMTGINNPVNICDIPKFEVLNGIRVNVYGFDPNEAGTYIYPIYVSSLHYERIVNLLIISNETKSHYVLIKSLDALLRTKTGHLHRMYTCTRCLQSFSSEGILLKHEELCAQVKFQRTVMPVDPIMKFRNLKYRRRNLITIYADFECILKPCSTRAGCQSELVAEHQPSGYGYIVVSPIPELCRPVKVFRGENTPDQFILDMLREYSRVSLILNTVKDMVFTESDQERFLNTSECGICLKALDWTDDKNTVVRDHDHVTGLFRSACHNECNIQMQQQKRIVIFCHNAKGYDNHFIIKSLAKFTQDTSQIDVVASTTEKFIRIKTPKFLFQDSFAHLSSSLDQLSKNLRDKGEENFPLIRNMFSEDTMFKALLTKGVYPYDYMTDFKKFNEPIPPIEQFYNSLNEKDLDEKEYERLRGICRLFNLQTLGHLHDHYLMTDVMILASVFEHYRDIGLNEYGLDPAFYLSAPSFSFDAMLFKTNVELELLLDEDMYEFFEQGKRGGVSSIFTRFASSNSSKNRNYDAKVDPSSLFYTDCNNLYGSAMMKKLPHRSFEWMGAEQLENIDILRYEEGGDVGMVLEVDLSYPTHLFDGHCDFPLAPEQLEITKEMLFPEATDFLGKHDFKFTAQKRLVPNFLPKIKYVVHASCLRFYVEQGLVIDNIHRGITFEQSHWLAPYIIMNTEKRQNASSKFEKDFYKLLVNSIFGKTMENTRKYRNICLATSEKQAKRYTNRKQFKSFQIISPHLVCMELEKTKVHLNKPIYAGMTILDLSKLHMYRFHYLVMKPLFNGKLELCFTDTDSLLYKIYKDNIAEDLHRIRACMDFSNYNPADPLYSEENKNVPGRFKDEMKGESILQFCGLRSKCYSIVTESEQKLAAAGVKLSSQKLLKHHLYVNAIASTNIHQITQNTIVSKKHNIYTQKSSRTGLSCLDIKRVVLPDGISTRPYGYFQ